LREVGLQKEELQDGGVSGERDLDLAEARHIIDLVVF
jgi:hypothetical protein